MDTDATSYINISSDQYAMVSWLRSLVSFLANFNLALLSTFLWFVILFFNYSIIQRNYNYFNFFRILIEINYLISSNECRNLWTSHIRSQEHIICSTVFAISIIYLFVIAGRISDAIHSSSDVSFHVGPPYCGKYNRPQFKIYQSIRPQIPWDHIYSHYNGRWGFLNCHYLRADDAAPVNLTARGSRRWGRLMMTGHPDSLPDIAALPTMIFWTNVHMYCRHLKMCSTDQGPRLRCRRLACLLYSFRKC